ncbi:MAG: 30S ribosomal protein S12 methylthiotransferase RimO [Ruminococcus sp.]|nr:30S ribosomal protein S12 methylthiotransferase RimO [Ruminococcus sp.]
MAIKVCMVSLGCSKNLVDSERMLDKIRKHGYELVVEYGESDITVVNTCGFIQSAKEEAIETILEIAQLKKEGTIKKIIVTGCLVERYKDELAQEFPEVDAVLGIGNQEDIVDVIDRVLHGQHVVSFDDKYRLKLTGDRIISTLPFFAYLKIAEGCSNRCSYCAIPNIRGNYRSVPMEDILKEANWLADNGVTELIVIAQDTTRYGYDLYKEYRLPKLLKELCKIDNLKWIRVLYCYPEKITDELLNVIATEDKIVKYLDIPIQHCNETVLKNMRRGGNAQKLRELFKHIREVIPNVTLRTTLITGFPQETEEQFTELAEFVKEIHFDRLGCFPYSQEEGTLASEMDGQLDEEIKNHRAEIIMEQQMLFSEENNEKKLNTIVDTVVEGFDKWAECYFGRTSADAPDIDGKIFFSSDEKLSIGQYVKVEVTDVIDYDLCGMVVSE